MARTWRRPEGEAGTLDSLNRQLSVLARSYADQSDAEYRAGNLRDSLNWMLRAYELAPREDSLRPSYLRLIGVGAVASPTSRSGMTA